MQAHVLCENDKAFCLAKVFRQGPREGWAEGALAPPLLGAIKKNIMQKLENSLVSD